MYFEHPCYDQIIDGDPDGELDDLSALVIDWRKAFMAPTGMTPKEPDIPLGELLTRYDYEMGRSVGGDDPPARTALDKKPRSE